MRAMLPGWRYCLWDDADNSALMARMFPEFSERYEAIRFGVAKADVARCAYMYAYGGFYLDTDYLLLRPLDDELRRHRCIVPLEGPPPGAPKVGARRPELGNAVLASEPEEPFWRDFIAYVFDVKEADRITDPQQIIPATGPSAINSFYWSRPSDYPALFLAPVNLFHPSISWFAMKTSADRDTYGVHLHWGSWRGRSVAVAGRNLLRRKLNGLLS
jgi:mannosyltransferase OCH1-like enzyme